MSLAGVTLAVAPAAIVAVRAARAAYDYVQFIAADATEGRLVALAFDDDGGTWPLAIYADGSSWPAAFEHVCRYLEPLHP